MITTDDSIRPENESQPKPGDLRVAPEAITWPPPPKTSKLALFDPAQVLLGWQCYVPQEPGTVIEVRILNGRKRGANFPKTWFGYFDNDADLITSLSQFQSWSGCYLTINPVNPILHARSYNRFMIAERGATTSDKDIVRRIWLPIDLDPVRPAGVSSSDEELSHAFALAVEIKSWLASLHWPAPVMAMSGNGYHLCYPIHLPADDGGLVSRVLQGLHTRFSNDRVSVDTTSFNPARIWKLPGTLACKGDSIPGREHKLSGIRERLNAGGELVAGEMLEAIASTQGTSSVGYRASTQQSTWPPTGQPAWDLLQLIEEYNIDCSEPKNWDGTGRLVTLNVCPCCEHGGDGPWLAQHASGAMSAGCHHNSCRGRWGWQEFKKTIGARPRHEPIEEIPGIDRIIANMLTRSGYTPKLPDLFKFVPVVHANASLPDPPEHPEYPENPEHNELLEAARDIPVPYDALDVPGLIGQVMQYNLQTAYSPQPELAFAGALCLMSAIVSRKVIDSRGTTPNVYVLGLAPTCSGKEHALEINSKILFGSGPRAASLVGNCQLASNSGVVNALFENGYVALFQVDEISRLVKMSGNPGSHLYRVGTLLLEIFSKARSTYISDALADRKKTKVLHRPHAVIHGTATDSGMWDSFAAESLTNGLVGRFIIVPGQRDPRLNDGEQFPPPAEIVNRVRDWTEWTPPAAGNLAGTEAGNEAIIPVVIQRTEEAAERFRAHSAEIRNRMAAENDTRRAIWGRSAEKAAKMALLFACSRSHAMEGAQITIDDVERAITIGNWTTASAHFWATWVK